MTRRGPLPRPPRERSAAARPGRCAAFPRPAVSIPFRFPPIPPAARPATWPHRPGYRFTNDGQADSVVGAQKPVAVRFQGQVYPISTWKGGTVKLVELFEATKPGLLASIVSKGELTAELSAEPDRFPRSKVLVGSVYFNTHASVHELKRRLKKIAERAGVRKTDYAFVMPDEGKAAGGVDATE